MGAIEIFDPVAPPARTQVHPLESFGCTDKLTGLPNRAYGEMKALQAIEGLNRFGIPFGWLSIALDDSDKFEHRYGQGFIDSALTVVARTLAHSLGAFDRLMRWDRTEFRAVARCATNLELLDTARKIAVLVRSSSLAWWGESLGIKISVGAVLAERGKSLQCLESEAADALKAVRASGGNGSGIKHAGSVELASGNLVQIL